MNLIVGGTGYLGSAAARLLLADSEPVRIMTRDPVRAADLAAAGAEVVQGNLVDRNSLVRACDGARKVLTAAHAFFGRGRERSERVDGAGMRDLIDIARDAGVERFVYTSIHDFGPEFREVPIFRIKAEVEDHLKASGLPFVILRPTVFMDNNVHLFIGQPIATKGAVTLMGAGDRPRNFIAAADVARAAVLALRDPTLVGKTLALGGPGHHSDLDVVRLYEKATGRTARVRHLPLGLLRLLSAASRPVHPGISQVMRAGIAAGTFGQRFQPPEGQEPLPIAFTSLEEWVTARAARDR